MLRFLMKQKVVLEFMLVWDLRPAQSYAGRKTFDETGPWSRSRWDMMRSDRPAGVRPLLYSRTWSNWVFPPVCLDFSRVLSEFI